MFHSKTKYGFTMQLDLSLLPTLIFVGVIWVTLEVSIITVVWRLTTGKWWWYKLNKDWKFTLSNDSWGFEGKGANPAATIKNLADDILGKNKTLDERIDDKINRMIDKQTDKILDLMLTEKNIKKQMQRRIFDILKTKLRTKMK